jgi:hypothetical protein
MQDHQLLMRERLYVGIGTVAYHHLTIRIVAYLLADPRSEMLGVVGECHLLRDRRPIFPEMVVQGTNHVYFLYITCTDTSSVQFDMLFAYYR